MRIELVNYLIIIDHLRFSPKKDDNENFYVIEIIQTFF